MNRSDVMEQFGLLVNQASADLNRYIDFAPNNMICNNSAQTYVRGPAFKRRFLQPDAGRYPAQLRSVADGILDHEDSCIAEHPVYDAAPTPVRGVKPEARRKVVRAIRRSEDIEVENQSLSRPAQIWRWISPDAIKSDGFRWHTRAFCLTDIGLKDSLLSRFLATRGVRPSGVEAGADTEWTENVTLEIGAHPELSESQKTLIALAYGMCDGKAKITVRCALLYYSLKRLGLDTGQSARRAQDQQIALLNRDEILGRRETAGEQ